MSIIQKSSLSDIPEPTQEKILWDEIWIPWIVNKIIESKKNIRYSKNVLENIILESDHSFEFIFSKDWKSILEMLFRPIDDCNKRYTWPEIQNILKQIRNKSLTFDLFHKNIKVASQKISNSNNQEKISINAYPEDLSNTRLITTLNNECDKYNIDHSNIVIEILEYQLWDYNDAVIHNLKQLKEHWYKVALDDWHPKSEDYIDIENHSHETLILLIWEWIELDLLKISWKYIHSLNPNSREFYFVSAMIKEFKNIKLQNTEIIWEWVDSIESMNTAVRMWCEWFQSRVYKKYLKEWIQISSWEIIPFGR